MDDRKDLTVPVPGELNDRIEAQLGYNDSKAAWIREAVRQRLEQEAAEEGDAESGSVEVAD